MIIKYIKLENFRQFKGSQIINFSTDLNKKATLVIAENTTGKTTLIESFSWILYGETKLKTILNTDVKTAMTSNSERRIYGEICLTHLGIDYIITREQKFYKSVVQITTDDSILSIETKDEKGISKKINGNEAKTIVNELVPNDLFPYFFFKGENIEKIGKEFSAGKSGTNNEFVRAIRGMLGFNWLYQAKKDLNILLSDYRTELQNNNNDSKLQQIMGKLTEAENNIKKYTEELEEIEKNLTKYREDRDTVSNEILKSGDVSEKQKRSLTLGVEIRNIEHEISSLRKEIFSKFSSQGYKLLGKRIIDETIELLRKEGNIDKGIPGLEAKAVQYMIDHKECICGTKLEEGSKEYNKLIELIKYLPPNNLGHEIEMFNSRGKNNCETADSFFEDLKKLRKQLRSQKKTLDDRVNEYNSLTEEIKNYPDMSKKKEREQELIDLISIEDQKKGSANSRLTTAVNDKEAAIKERSNHTVSDSHNKKLQECELQVDMLIKRIDKYCKTKEKEKRDELEIAINEIFSGVFGIDIKLELTNDYGINLISGENTELSDFENSTSQDAIMAFSFIGGIIKLARNKATEKTNEDEFEDDTLAVEPYPLVMDAPSSSFDIARIKNFCHIMPNIAEQVIFFIKDTDGQYVKKYLANSIGKEYRLNKLNKYETEVKEV